MASTNDIYDFNAQYQGAKLVTAREMKLVVAGKEISNEYLVQNVVINYQQPVQIIRELSTGNAYYNTLPPQGTVSFGRIIGTNNIASILGAPGTGVWTAPKGGTSAADGRVASLKPVTGATGPTYTMYGCIVNNFTSDIDANRGLIQEGVQMRFGNMSIS